MTGIRLAAAALPFAVAMSLAAGAVAQTPPKPPATAAAPAGDPQPTLLRQYGDWGAYAPTPAGGRGCFALAQPKRAKTEPGRRKPEPSLFFVPPRPAGQR